ncbi:MAG TPA: SMP-30/gluconolactonase/LRE family protein [Actinomycetota bacterium]
MELEAFESVATGLDHPEGVAWADGRLVAGGEAGQFYAVDAASGDVVEIASTGGFLYGVTPGAEGSLLGCDFGRAALMRVSAEGEVTTLSLGAPDAPLRVPNFAAYGDDGTLYVTDSGTWGEDDGVLLRVRPDGATDVWSREVPAFPNGCCLTVEGDALLVVESRGRRVVRVPIRDGGAAGPPTVVADLTGSQPDGIALAADGTMFVGCYRPDRIWRIPPGGEPQVWAEDPDGVVLNQPANIAFFGPGLDRLVVSSLGGWSLMAADPGVPGLALRIPG